MGLWGIKARNPLGEGHIPQLRQQGQVGSWYEVYAEAGFLEFRKRLGRSEDKPIEGNLGQDPDVLRASLKS